jgi:hypothetical protein
MNGSLPSTLMGMAVAVDPLCDDVPRMQTSRRFAELMPAEFVAELDAWMLEFFGRKNIVYAIGGHTLVVGPKTLRAMKEQL